MNELAAVVELDMDEIRTVWCVYIYDKNDDLVEKRPFAEKDDADNFALTINGVER